MPDQGLFVISPKYKDKLVGQTMRCVEILYQTHKNQRSFCTLRAFSEKTTKCYPLVPKTNLASLQNKLLEDISDISADYQIFREGPMDCLRGLPSEGIGKINCLVKIHYCMPE